MFTVELVWPKQKSDQFSAAIKTEQWCSSTIVL